MFYNDNRKGRGILLPATLLVVAGVIGTLIGKLIGAVLPFKEGILYEVISGGRLYGFDPFDMDLGIAIINFGFKIEFNIFSLIFIALALYIFKKA